MAEAGRYPLGNQLDIQQILVEAQHRWLRPAEICEILCNYKKFHIAPQPAHMPPSGSLFLFDRKLLRYFRKDGHNWRKKKDGKTVKEAHERLKSGSIDVLHCYYAHGEENENFQRRSYWMLEEALSHIVLVHYREVKGNRTNFNQIKKYGEPIPYSQETEDTLPNSEMDTSVSSNFHPNIYEVPRQNAETTSMNSAQAFEYEDAESVSSRCHSFLKVEQPAMDKIGAGLSDPQDPLAFSGGYEGNFSAVPAQGNKAKDNGINRYAHEPQKYSDLPSWEDVLESCILGSGSMQLQPSFSSQADMAGITSKQDDGLLAQLFTNNFGKRQEFGNNILMQEQWQNVEDGSPHLSKWAIDQKLHSELTYDLTARFDEQESDRGDLINASKPFHAQEDKNSIHNNLHIQLSNVEHGPILEGISIFSSPVKQHLLDGSLTGGLKKLDSFDRWMSKELGDVNEPCIQSGSGADWDTIENEHGVGNSNIPSPTHLDNYMLGPSLSQNQLFSIIDFSPNWVHVGSKIKVLITGRFLKSREEAENCKWSCMFGEIEVPAEVIADSVLRCHTPLHKAGRVSFYVTCSDRVACSEVREFEYRLGNVQDVNITDNYSDSTRESLHMRLVKLLCQSTIPSPIYNPSNESEISQLSGKISSLLKEDNDGWDQMLKVTSEEAFSSEVKERLLQRLLKEKLYVWLLQKAAEGGKGPAVLDENGQGVIHFAAALGYDWALEPTITAGVKVNFRDVNGWTALHWAASCGRERTVASLIDLGAAPGALTDPNPKDPTGRTPADLASANKHKGIAGYLAEYALSSHLETLNLDKQNGDAAAISVAKTVTASQHSATPVNENLEYGLSMKDSLAAFCNATQAAARIHQVFRVQSFQKKQLKEYDDKFGMSDEHALSLVTLKANKVGQHDEPVHAAATQIQNKFRGWKGRKDFLVIRQQIIKIQAHVRGHQVRKNNKNIIWSVGIVEKIILRWRRKGSGLRGFKSEALTEGRHIQGTSSWDDDYDFFKEGRKQTEERSQVALARVKSMLQYPEARDQYTRLRNVVTEIQEMKIMKSLGSNLEASTDFDDMIDLETLLDNDLFMPTDS